MLTPGDLEHPIIGAPLGGGPSTVELAAAVSDAGGLGFLAAAYKTAAATRDDIAALRERTSRAFGVNVFVPAGGPADPGTVAAYADELRAAGVEVGEGRWDDDDWDAKAALLVEARPDVASFTFGRPPVALVDALHERDVAVWTTVTTPQEAVEAVQGGADALICQGFEAGGHRSGPGDYGLLALLQVCLDAVPGTPLVATGGIVTGAGVRGALAAGAAAVALGTAFMRTPEAGTVPAHRDALASAAPTGITTAFTGRAARGIVNAFMREHTGPVAYPEVHHLTAPSRAAARKAGDAERFNLWAGQAHALATEEPAGDLVRRLSAEARRG